MGQGELCIEKCSSEEEKKISGCSTHWFEFLMYILFAEILFPPQCPFVMRCRICLQIKGNWASASLFLIAKQVVTIHWCLTDGSLSTLTNKRNNPANFVTWTMLTLRTIMKQTSYIGMKSTIWANKMNMISSQVTLHLNFHNGHSAIAPSYWWPKCLIRL